MNAASSAEAVAAVPRAKAEAASMATASLVALLVMPLPTFSVLASCNRATEVDRVFYFGAAFIDQLVRAGAIRRLHILSLSIQGLVDPCGVVVDETLRVDER